MHTITRVVVGLKEIFKVGLNGILILSILAHQKWCYIEEGPNVGHFQPKNLLMLFIVNNVHAMEYMSMMTINCHQGLIKVL